MGDRKQPTFPMIVVISGTNRPDSNTRKIAGVAADMVVAAGQQATILDLCDLPPELFSPASYNTTPEGFAPFQHAMSAADGVLCVVPEYNGSFPGALKYFIDMLAFPQSLVGTIAAFIGISSGPWGGVRAVEQLEMVFQYRHAHLYGRRVFLPAVAQMLDENGRLAEPAAERRLREMVTDFVRHCTHLSTL